jgi:hypothetical protein
VHQLSTHHQFRQTCTQWNILFKGTVSRDCQF